MTDPVESSKAAAEAELRFLAAVLILFAAVKLAFSGLAFGSALMAAGGNDADGTRTLFWMPQILFYVVYLLAARRLRRRESGSRNVVVSLSVLALVAETLYAIAVFTVGPGREQPAFALAMELRLLASGDIWDLVFPVLALVWLRRPALRALFEAA